MFADDLKLYITLRINSPEEALKAIVQFQSNIQKFLDVAKSWGLRINKDKCFAMRFKSANYNLNEYGPFASYSIDNNPIDFVTTYKDLGVLVDNKLKFHDHIRTTAGKAGGVANNILIFTVCRDQKMMIPIYKSHIRPILEYSSCLWNTGYITDLNLLEKIQRHWTRQIQGLENLRYEERLQSLSLYSLHGRLLRADLIMVWKIFHSESTINPDDLFILNPPSSTRGHKYKIFKTRFNTDARSRFFSQRIINR